MVPDTGGSGVVVALNVII